MANTSTWRALAGAALGAGVAVALLFSVNISDLVHTLVRSGGPALAVLFLFSPLAVLLLAMRSIRRVAEHRLEIRKRARAHRAAHALAKRDPLTGLYNRRGLIEDISVLAREGAARGRPLVLMIIDLDNFKIVNDQHGHLTGDDLLREVAERISASCPDDALVARMGGDEFAVAFTFETGFQIVPESVCCHLLDALNQPIEVQELNLTVGASIGIAMVSDGIANVSTLLRQADVAMYRAKQAGRNCFRWFDASMEQDIRERAQLESELRSAVQREEIVPYYEMQKCLETGEIVGFEVLARWQHPVRGLVEPALFITIAEECGLIGELSLQLLRRALTEARGWSQSYRVSFNVAPAQLRDPNFAQQVLKILTETRFAPHLLEVEMTESVLISDAQLAKSVVSSLKNQGVRLALDDFGTGYSSLQHLRALPFDRIKIDRSFVRSLGESTESDAIVTAVLGLGRSLNVEVIAEGVETAAIETRLKELGCTHGQGWLFSKPVSGADVQQLIEALRNAELSENAALFDIMI